MPLAEALNGQSGSTPLTAAVTLEGDRIRVAVRSRPEAADVKPGSGWVGLGNAATEFRRTLQRLRSCAEVADLEHRLAIAEALAVRVRAKANKWLGPEEQAQVDRLPKLETTLERLSGLEARAEAFEAETLVAVYGEPPPDAGAGDVGQTPSLPALRNELNDVLRWILWLRTEHPDTLVLAVYSEDETWLSELARAYHDAFRDAGHTFRVEQVVPSQAGRDSKPAVRRQAVHKPVEFLAEPHLGVLGILFEIEGFLAWPRWRAEAGRHLLEKAAGTAVAVVETANRPAAEYQVPEGAARPGGLKASHRCRSYDRVCGRVDDAVLGRRASALTDLSRTVAVCVADRFDRAVQEPIASGP